jgi:translation initiation factor IF-3
MAHTQYGFQVVQKFLVEIAPYGHPDFEPKLIGRGINVMISPLPRNKRPRNARQLEGPETQLAAAPAPQEPDHRPQPAIPMQVIRPPQPQPQTPVSKPGGFVNNPFAALEIK